jgi:uncharacterized protein (DUF2236 family)
MSIETISRGDLEEQLASIRALVPGGAEGLFGPASVTWRVDREAAIFLGTGRALFLQLAHPWVAAAISEHSRTSTDRIGRFHRTFGVVFGMVFGSLEQAFAAARRLHRRHAAIHGFLAVAVGPFAAGSIYRANDLAALRWVHATLIDTALLIHDLVLGPLQHEELERYYSESKLFAALFGIPQNCLPSDWAAFAAYNQSMWESDTLTVSRVGRKIAHQLVLGGDTWLCPPRWYQAITAHILPGRLRQGFGLQYDSNERDLARDALAWIRRFYPTLPGRLRYVGPYQEAMARLSGRAGSDFGTQLLNRLWIGQPSLA